MEKDLMKRTEELDKKNSEKEKLNFHPLGQGRLAIVYFADSAEYETVYKDETGKYRKNSQKNGKIWINKVSVWY